MQRLSQTGLLTAALLVGACSRQPRALTASSAGETTYALGYVDSLGATRTEEQALESQVDTGTTALQTYPAALSTPSWRDVLVVYDAADAAGRSSDYVDEVERDKAVAQFYVEEKDELDRRVGGAAQYAAKQKKDCDVELSGPISYALGKAFDDRIRDRVRKHSDAFLYIADHEDALGKKNRSKLEDQADAISQTSYSVYIAAPELHERLVRQANEASDVDHTLALVADDAHRVGTDDKEPQPIRARAEAREQQAIAARQRLAGEAAETKKLADAMADRIKQMHDKYEAAYKALRQDVQARAK